MESGYKRLIYKKLFLGVIIHAVILWAALALGYGSYKEWMREIEPLTRDVKGSIKATFPWAILIFSGLYFIFFRLRKTFETNRTNETNKTFNPQTIFLNISQYVFMLTLYGVLINVFFFSKGRDIFIPLNLSIFYLVIFLNIFWGLSRIMTIEIKDMVNLHSWLPPIIYRFLMGNPPKVQAYIKERPSHPFILGFMSLLIICAFLLIFKHEKSAERAANIAYFALVIGVGIEVYQLIRHKNADEEKD